MILCIGTTPAVQRVMVFGKVLLDGVNRAATTMEGPAGKSINVARVLRALGEAPLATGFLGGDRGEYLRGCLRSHDIKHDFIEVPARTRQCVTVIDQSQGTHTELVEESSAVTAGDVQRLFELVEKHIPRCRAVVMSGSLAPGVPDDFYFQVTRLARKVRALSVVDAQGKGLLEAIEAGPSLVKPNRSELAAALGRKLPGEAEVRQAMREIGVLGAGAIVVTSGKEGALASDGKGVWRIVPPRLSAVNPIGAGDAFTAGLVWRLAGGDDLREACRWACAAGAADALTLMPGDIQKMDVERLAGGVEILES